MKLSKYNFSDVIFTVATSYLNDLVNTNNGLSFEFALTLAIKKNQKDVLLCNYFFPHGLIGSENRNVFIPGNRNKGFGLFDPVDGSVIFCYSPSNGKLLIIDREENV